MDGRARVLGNDRFNAKHYAVVLPEEYDTPEGWFALAKKVCRQHERIFGLGTSKVVRGVWRTHPPMFRLYNPDVTGDAGAAEWTIGGGPGYRGRNFKLSSGEIQISVGPYYEGGTPYYG